MIRGAATSDLGRAERHSVLTRSLCGTSPGGMTSSWAGVANARWPRPCRPRVTKRTACLVNRATPALPARNDSEAERLRAVQQGGQGAAVLPAACHSDFVQSCPYPTAEAASCPASN